MAVKRFYIENIDQPYFDHFGFLMEADGVRDGVYIGEQNVWQVVSSFDEVKNLVLSYRTHDGEDKDGLVQDLEIEGKLRAVVDDYVVPNSTDWYLDVNEWELTTFEDGDRDTYYEWWDGSNWRDKAFSSADLTAVEMDDDARIGFDVYDPDSGDYYTSHKFHHMYACKAVTVDDKPVTDKWVLVSWSQWQGSHPQAVVMDTEGILAQAEDLPNGKELVEELRELI